MKVIVFIIIILLITTGCFLDEESGEVVIPERPTDITSIDYGSLRLPTIPFQYANVELPPHMTQRATINRFFEQSILGSDNMPVDNPITDPGATLGRVLFYDKQLSANGTTSCASCHIQENGFSDPAVFSRGFDGGMTRRQSMTLVNTRYFVRGRFFWDERATSLEDQVLRPFLDPVEMGLDMDTLVEIISSQSYYPILFSQAFGDNEINPIRIARALAQFVRSIVSYRTQYDEGRAQVGSVLDDFPNFSSSENLGKSLFFSTRVSCFGCHTTEGFVSAPLIPQNNGLDIASGEDKGALETYPNRSRTDGAFKIPTLRNIAVTAPYMHDGRFKSLEEVINHYDSGVKAHPALSIFMLDNRGNIRRPELSREEQEALVNFLETLTDEPLNRDIRFSDPFK